MPQQATYRSFLEMLSKKAVIQEKNSESKVSHLLDVALDINFKKHIEDWEKIITTRKATLDIEMRKVRILHASVNSAGNLMKDDKGNYEYKPEKAIELEDAIAALVKKFEEDIETHAKEEISYEPYILSGVTTEISSEIIEKLSPFFV